MTYPCRECDKEADECGSDYHSGIDAIDKSYICECGCEFFVRYERADITTTNSSINKVGE